MLIRLKQKKYSDKSYIQGLQQRDKLIEQACYDYLRKYFEQNYRGLFFIEDEQKNEIFQESYITFWQNVENRKIYVEDDVLKGRDGSEFRCSLTTYFMGIARLKYLEWTRQNKSHGNIDDDERYIYGNAEELYTEILYDMEDTSMTDIISDCISRLSTGCTQIMTLFYYKEKSLDEIMIEVPTYKSKDALKTAKYKCMQNLKKCATSTYERFNSNR